MYGALDWLGVPSVTPADILFFVRGISKEGQISYSQFLDILMPPDEEEQLSLLEGAHLLADGAGAVGFTASDREEIPPKRQRSRVPPKGEVELEEMRVAMICEEQRVEAALEKAEAQQVERAKQFLHEQMLDSDFLWIKQVTSSSVPLGAIMAPRTTRPPVTRAVSSPRGSSFPPSH